MRHTNLKKDYKNNLVSLEDKRIVPCQNLVEINTSTTDNEQDCIGESKQYLSILETAKKLKGMNYNVLLQGETGTGKEVLARYIYRQEKEPNRPFVTINCGAIPENLFESELFGYEAGAFTGATKRYAGKFEQADGGDIFLDEINTVKPELQCKLLRVIQEQEFYRVGGSQPVKVNVRIIAASSVSLREEMLKGHFRQDLYYRLNVCSLNLPALRDRKEDIVLLANYFLKKAAQGKPKKLSQQAIDHILNYRWPGNVRELKHTMEALAILSQKEEITVHDFPAWMSQNERAEENKIPLDKPYTKYSLKEYLNVAKKDYILKCLEDFGGNIFKTAQALRVARSTIYNALNKQEI